MADMAIITIYFTELFCDIDVCGVRDAEYTGDEIGEFQLHLIELLFPMFAEIVMDRFANFPDLFRQVDACVGEGSLVGRIDRFKH